MSPACQDVAQGAAYAPGNNCNYRKEGHPKQLDPFVTSEHNYDGKNDTQHRYARPQPVKHILKVVYFFF